MESTDFNKDRGDVSMLRVMYTIVVMCIIAVLGLNDEEVAVC